MVEMSKDCWSFGSRQNYGLIRLKALAAISICLAIALSPATAAATELKPESINSAEYSDKSLSADRISPLVVRVQALLARARFSPGEIDGKFGENVKKALGAYAEARQLSRSGELSQELWQKLASDDQPVLTQYTIQPKDIAGPFLERGFTRKPRSQSSRDRTIRSARCGSACRPRVMGSTAHQILAKSARRSPMAAFA